jgi:hypothetical protein
MRLEPLYTVTFTTPEAWSVEVAADTGIEVLLDPVDAEGSPSDPGRPFEACRLRNIPGVHNRKQRRVYEQGLGIAHKLRQNRAPQGLQEAS